MAAQVVPSLTRWFTPAALAVNGWGVRYARERVLRGNPTDWAAAWRAFQGVDVLRPGGRLFIREGHPVLWSLDDEADTPTLRYPYFEHTEPVVFDEPGTYVETDVVLTHGLSHSWNHGLGEIITALLDAGLRLTQFVEHDSVHWNALPGQMVMGDTGEWRLATAPERLPASYTIQAVKP